MPQVFKVGSYWVYFWTDEHQPLEPVHVHIAEGKPKRNATKVWISRRGGCLLCHNRSRIPKPQLKIIMELIEAHSDLITRKWQDCFHEISFYC